jgi:glycosyltransferase involved in cell wall biosynthesis
MHPELLVEYHFAQSALVTFPLFLKRDVPRIFHFHGPWYLEGLAQGNSKVKSGLKFLVEKVVYDRQSMFTTHSEAFKKLLMQKFSVPDDKIKCIYPGVDLVKFDLGSQKLARERLGLPPEGKLILCLRRLEPRMGIELAIDAMGSFKDCVLVIAGKGSLDNSLRMYARSKPYANRIVFTGPISDENHNAIYQAVDLVVVPSISFEGFGLIVWEAFASGKPVVSSNVGGLPEAMLELNDEYTFLAGSQTDLENKIRKALNETWNAESIRQMVQPFTWQKTAQDIEIFVESRTKGRR